MASFCVSGKTAIVTGAGSGINLCFAELLLSRGCNVVLADISCRPEAEGLIARYQTKGKGPRAVFVKTDVTSWPALRNMFEVALHEFGGFDIVCPGAGVYEPNWTNFWHPPGSPESKDGVDGGRYALLDINLTHPLRATQLALSYWLHPPAGSASSLKASRASPKSIVHVSSIAGYISVFRAPLYAAAKFGVTGFVRSLAALESVGVRVTAVAPGVVRTPLWTEHPEKLLFLNEKRDAWVTPEEVAEAMLSCVESEQHPGGTILEVGANNTRHVTTFNDPGPDMRPGKGFATSNAEKGDEVIWEWLGDSAIWKVKSKI